MRKISTLLILLIGLSPGAIVFADPSEESEGVAVKEKQHDQVFDLHGSAEIQFRSEEGFDDPDTQSSTTNKTDLSLDLELIYAPTDWSRGNLALTWDDKDGFDVEEGFLTLGNTDDFPGFVSGGKMILPFGFYETSMISDSLALEIGETHTQAVMLGMEYVGFSAALFLYNGKTVNDDDGSALRAWGGDIRYLWEKDQLTALFGTSWIENIEDSDGLKDSLHDEDLSLKHRVPGLSAYAFVNVDQLSLTLEYVSALKHPEFRDEEQVEKHDCQLAWAAELDYTFGSISDMETIAAFSYSRSDGLGDLLPKKRIGCAITVLPYEYLSLAVEYLREYDYSVSSGGTNDKADIFTFEVAVQY